MTNDYVKFEDLKVGEYYDIVSPNIGLENKGCILESVLSKGEKVFRCTGSTVLIFEEYEGYKFKPHRPPILTEEIRNENIDQLDELIEDIKNFKEKCEENLDEIDAKILELSKILEPENEVAK